MYDGLPQELKALRQFTVYTPDKHPFTPSTGRPAKVGRPETWEPFEDAVAAYKAAPETYAGIGFVFNNNGIVGVDLDHVRDPETGKVTPEAEAIVELLDSYTEISPSGTGLHIYVRGTIPENGRKSTKRGIEMYQAGRFFTVTGNVYGTERPLEDRQKEIIALYRSIFGKPRDGRQDAQDAPQTMEDQEVLDRALNAHSGAAFARLFFEGDATGYPSASEADQALVNMLVPWTQNMEQIGRLLRASGLYRPKLDRDDYIERTAKNAIRTLHGYRLRKAAASFAVEPPDYSDAGNAEVFTNSHKGTFIFSDALGWAAWDGLHWERNDHLATAAAVKLTGLMYAEASTRFIEALHKEDQIDKGELDASPAEAKKAVAAAKAYRTHALKSRNASRIAALLQLSKPPLWIKAERLDANPFDLNTPAGIVDLRTGAIRPNDPAAYCTQITEATPDTDPAGRQLWTDFLETITCGDAEVARFLQDVAGIAAIGKVYQESIIIAYGGGRNGKSTFFNALGRVLGTYSNGIDVNTLTTDKGNRGAALATLRGRRLVVTGELEEHQRLSVATLKRLASTDMLTIEEKFRAPETIKPTHTLVLFTNHLPRVGSTDGGTWRRLTVVPFNATIPEGKGVQNFADVLADRAGGAILSWCIEGAARFYAEGCKLHSPQAVRAATEAYRQREDWINNFIAERCICEDYARVGAAELYAEYRMWAERNGDYVRRLTDFNAALEAQGYDKITPKNKKTWVGLRVNYGADFPDD